MTIIRGSFVDKNGKEYKGIVEKAFEKGELAGNLGKFVAETNREEGLFYSDKKVYIYQDEENPNIAYRIYNEFADPGFNGYYDEKMIFELNHRKANIKLSKFPYGVVTLDGFIIGQIIPYFDNCLSLFELVKSNKKIDILKYYRYILRIIEELYNSGIIYMDIHSKNFMIDKQNLDNVNIIDFDEQFVKFDNNYYLRDTLNHFIDMINDVNEIVGIDNVVGRLNKVDDFKEAKYNLDIMEKKLKR